MKLNKEYVELFALNKRYPDIPFQLLKWLAQLKGNSASPPYSKVLDLKTLSNINSKFETGKRITALSPGDLLRKLDFSPRDISGERFDSIMAELRVIHWLDELGAKKIRPVKAGKDLSSDIYCFYGNGKVVVEVFCSPNSKGRWNLTQYYVLKANQKKKQLDNSANTIGAHRRLIILVLDSSPARELKDKSDYTQDLRTIVSQLKWGRNYFFGIMTSNLDWAVIPETFTQPPPTETGQSNLYIAP